MKWLKQKYQENPAAFLFGVTAVLTTTASVMLLKSNTKLQAKVANNAKDVLQAGFDAFNEGYEVAIAEIEEIAASKELQKAIKSAAKAA